MAESTGGRGKERRREPRVQCRLHGQLTRGRERIRVRIVDVSEGGVCLLSPVWLDPKKPVAIAIDVPGRGPARVQVEIWHVRREKSRSSNGKIWVAGALLREGDEAFAGLLESVGLRDRAAREIPARPATKPPAPASPPQVLKAPEPEPEHEPELDEEIDAYDPRTFRLRCKAKGNPRTRTLTLAAASAEEARKIAERDLGVEWELLEVVEL